jgi:exodeoxyribonuclease III
VKIATYNVNSIRRRLQLVLGWLEEHKPDALCLQETKVHDDEFPALAFQAAGYHATYRGMKSYNGVATLTRSTPEDIRYGFSKGPDSEDVRVLTVNVGGVSIINTYVPQGHSIHSEKYVFKLAWFARLRRFFETHFEPGQPVIWLGDMNVAPEPIDVYHPDRRVNDVDFHIDARNAYKEVAAWGFVDTFRALYPERVQYTYWDYFRNAFQNNWGWRIDHIMATPDLAGQCKIIEVDMALRAAPGASDHTLVWAELQ